MAPQGSILRRCPKCGWTFIVDKGDRLHPGCTTDRPRDSDVKDEIIERVYDCRNPECLNPITVYYYRSKSFFKRA